MIRMVLGIFFITIAVAAGITLAPLILETLGYALVLMFIPIFKLFGWF